QSPFLKNPATGWLYNTNNWPYSAAGPSSPKQSEFPKYVDNGSENFRGVHALRLLPNKKDLTLNTLLSQVAFDSYLPAFEAMIPTLLKAWEALPASDPLKTKLSPQIGYLRAWDYRWSQTSIPTSIAVFYGEELGRRVGSAARAAGVQVDQYMATRAEPAV